MRTQEDFNAFELKSRDGLSGRSLVVEANADPAEAATAFRILGSNYAGLSSPERRESLLRKYRGALVVGICEAGARGYGEGSFWPAVGDAFGVQLVQTDQQALSRAFRESLDAFGLSRFTTPRRNIGEILMHAGVPIGSVESFIRLLQRRDARTPGLDGRLFASWLRSMSQPLAVSHGIDVPTYQFIVEGREVAEDLVDRCLSLLDQAAGDDTVGDAKAGLPMAIAAELERLIASRELDRSATRGTGRRGEVLYPRLCFKNGAGVQVHLPPLEVITGEAVSWRIAAEGLTARLDVPAPWPGDPVQPNFSSVGRAAKSVTVTVQPGDQTWDLALVDVDDPLIVFDAETGLLVPPRSDMPKGSVWLIFPNQDNELLEAIVEADGPIRELGHTEAPYGWTGWTFAEVDLSAISRLRYRSSERWRYVSSVVRPALVGLEPVPHVKTIEGRTVSSQRPSIVLPPSPAAADEQTSTTISWTVSIVRSGSASPMLTETFESQPRPRTVYPWGPSKDEPLLGDFVVSVKGPLGRGITTRVAVAEDVSVVASTPFRPMNTFGTGLTEATVQMSPLGGHEGSALVLQFAASETEKPASITGGHHRLPVIVSLPHMTATVKSDAGHLSGIRPQRVNLEDLASTELRVSLPPTSNAELYLEANGSVLQVLRGGGHGSCTFNLAALSATAAGVGSASLLLRVDGSSIPVANIRPKQLASSVRVDDLGVLQIETNVGHADLTCAFYPAYAPWVAPYVIPIVNGASASSLPREVLEEGRGWIVLRIDDPWNPTPWPQVAGAGTVNVFALQVGQLTDSPGLRESGFRTWLARLGPCPSSAESTSVALNIYSLLRHFRTETPRRTLRQELAEAVRPHRASAISAVLEIDTPASQLMRLFVESEIVTVPGEHWASLPLLWSYSVGLAVLADSDQVGTDDELALLDALESHVGSAAPSIIRDGLDPYAAVGRFGPQMRVLNAWPQERIDEVWAAASPLPGHFLDEDPRANSAKELFDHRRDREVLAVAVRSRSLIEPVNDILKDQFGEESLKPIRTRRVEDGWMDLPAISLALGFSARMAAMGISEAAAVFASTKALYADLAHAAPSMVERDLALAELWLTRWRTQ